MDATTTARALARAAYEQGWRDACDDHMQQHADGSHPIGLRRKSADELLAYLDPRNLLGLKTGV